MLFDYLHTNTKAVICYHASDMILKIVPETAFFILPRSLSQAAAIYHLGRKENKPEEPRRRPPPKNQECGSIRI